MPKQQILAGKLHDLPKDIEKTLISNKDLLEKWNNLTPLARNEWICWVTIVKKKETRENHIQRLKEDILKGKKGHAVGPVVLIIDQMQKNGFKTRNNINQI